MPSFVVRIDTCSSSIKSQPRCGVICVGRPGLTLPCRSRGYSSNEQGGGKDRIDGGEGPKEALTLTSASARALVSSTLALPRASCDCTVGGRKQERAKGQRVSECTGREQQHCVCCMPLAL